LRPTYFWPAMDAVKTVLNWSSGKDAALAYYKLLQGLDYKVCRLLTTISEEYNRVFMHGTRSVLLDMQAERMGMPLTKITLPSSTGDELYKAAMSKALAEMAEEGIHSAAFGDIFLEDLRLYREQQLGLVEFNGIFPLWKEDTRALVAAVEDAGIQAIIVCVSDRHLGKEWLGRKIDRELLRDLPPGVDPCGENGEYHSFVYNAPFFREPIPIATGEVVYKKLASGEDGGWDSGFYFLDVLPQA
jgi:uncharacterized protein (TIGR00290 family)